MKLNRMLESELDKFNKINIEELTSMYSLKMSENEAKEKAQSEQYELLSEGVNTKDHFLYTIKTDSDKKVGSIWFGKMERDSKDIAFIFYIRIDNDKRGRGFGKSAIKMIEEEIKKIGIDTIRLHVLKDNITANKMYKNLGYNIFKDFDGYKEENLGEVLEKKLKGT